jgi:hypothetical protein
MSGVEDPATIDLVTHDPRRDQVVLVMTEMRDWGTTGGLLLDLQEKIRNYLHFVESGQLDSKYPGFAGRSVRIRLDCVAQPGPLEEKFLQRVREAWLAPGRIELEVRVMPKPA